ncbi:hypothetical protein BJ508DRAFT_163139 [Ascobolus immersus RN42]|uniref:Zn(2)-C6 fungal-type domain-containing protein n=1 Tax=Ascobolus immersus RN42 TaxID=1160509 RepID=A0A3N4HVS8_ASCIM|nr:hypothetical protein BJ508DRAFT_163139 [Ascobolus immersus RN42]
MNMVEHPDSNRSFRGNGNYYSSRDSPNGDRGSPSDPNPPYPPQHTSPQPNSLPPIAAYASGPPRTSQAAPTSYPNAYAPPIPNGYPVYSAPPNSRFLPSISAGYGMAPLGPAQPHVYGYAAPNGTMSYPQLSPTSQPMQMPYPPQGEAQGKLMSGGRHKKEIKRRTKTGCLTCRKRRIKCDEAHPTCNNCKKSKRECMGYDPVFKTTPGPVALQPAPTPAMDIQNIPVQHPLPGYPIVPLYQSSRTQSSSPSGTSNGGFSPEYRPSVGPPIDPTLESISSSMASQPVPVYAPSTLPESYAPVAGMKRPYEEGMYSSVPEPAPVTSYSSNPGSPHGGYGSGGEGPTKRICVTNLLNDKPLPASLLEPLPVSQLVQPTPDQLYPPAYITADTTTPEGTVKLYREQLAKQLDDFFDTDWFSIEGLAKITSWPSLSAAIADASKGSGTTAPMPPIEPDGDADFLCTVFEFLYRIDIRRVRPSGQASSAKREEVARRLESVQALITLRKGSLTGGNNASPPHSPSGSPTTSKESVATDFWNRIRKIASIDPAKDLDALDRLIRSLYDLYPGDSVPHEKSLLRSIAESKYITARRKANRNVPGTDLQEAKGRYEQLMKHIEDTRTNENVVLSKVSKWSIYNADADL